MEIRKFFAESSALAGNTITLTGDEFFHLKKVLRLKVGFKILVYLNDGKEYHCKIDKLADTYATCTVETVAPSKVKNLGITLFCALMKGGKTDFVVQKAVEIGAKSVVTFTSEYTSETKFSLDRLRRIALEACKQCGSAMLTEVTDLKSYDEVLKLFCGYDKIIFAYENETKQMISTADFSGENIAIVVGSEGGFSPREVDEARKLGTVTVSLGERILRAETAAVVMLAIASLKRGGM